MSSNSIVLNTGQQATINTDLSKLFIWNNRYEGANYTNSTGATVVLPAGTVMGRVSATQKVVPLTSAASDGSQFVVGVLADDYSVVNGVTQAVTFCTEGDVNESGIILQGSDTLDTVIAGRSIRDRIAGDTVGIKLTKVTENTAFDN